MEFIAAAVCFLAVFVPLFLAAELAAGHPEAVRHPAILSPEAAASRYLEAHPLKSRPAVAANDEFEREAA